MTGITALQPTTKDHTLDPDTLLTEGQLAERLGFTRRALQQWRITGAGPRFIRISARAIRYRWGDVLTWLEEHTRTSTSDMGGGPQ